MSGDAVRLLRAAHPADPLRDMAISDALLREVAAGAAPAVRVFRPGPTMAFGRLDRRAPGFPAAAAAAAGHGYVPVVRLGGGRAAGYDDGSVVVEIVRPEPAVAQGITERFREGTALVAEALAAVGIDPQVGELPGEYCPGTWSVHAGGVKLAGTAQRAIRGASLLAAVVVAEHGARLRAALVDVYAALGIAWDPRTAGAAADVAPGTSADAVERALLDAVAARWDVAEAVLGPQTLGSADALRAEHVADVPAA